MGRKQGTGGVVALHPWHTGAQALGPTFMVLSWATADHERSLEALFSLHFECLAVEKQS